MSAATSIQKPSEDRVQVSRVVDLTEYQQKLMQRRLEKRLRYPRTRQLDHISAWRLGRAGKSNFRFHAPFTESARNTCRLSLMDSLMQILKRVSVGEVRYVFSVPTCDSRNKRYARNRPCGIPDLAQIFEQLHAEAFSVPTTSSWTIA